MRTRSREPLFRHFFRVLPNLYELQKHGFKFVFLFYHFLTIFLTRLSSLQKVWSTSFIWVVSLSQAKHKAMEKLNRKVFLRSRHENFVISKFYGDTVGRMIMKSYIQFRIFGFKINAPNILTNWIKSQKLYKAK